MCFRSTIDLGVVVARCTRRAFGTRRRADPDDFGDVAFEWIVQLQFVGRKHDCLEPRVGHESVSEYGESLR